MTIGAPIFNMLQNRLFRPMENSMLGDTLLKEVVGINAPKIAVTRTTDERVDTAISELGNTVGFLGLGYAADVVAKKAFARHLNNKMAHLGMSGAVYSAIFSFMWAMPFIRNYITAKRTGKVDFAGVIGGKSTANNNPQQYEQKVREYRNKAGMILGLGGLGMLASILGARGAIAKNLGASLVKFLGEKQWLLKNGSFSDFGGRRALLFWGVPAYGGWIHASRDPYEAKEQLLKFGTFVAGFSVVPEIAKRLFDGPLDNIRRAAGGEKVSYALVEKLLKQGKITASEHATALRQITKKNLFGMGASILALGGSQLVNILWTDKRMARDSQQRPVDPASTAQQPFAYGGTLRRKPFEAWGQRNISQPSPASYYGA